jgi:hypothetical protein
LTLNRACRRQIQQDRRAAPQPCHHAPQPPWSTEVMVQDDTMPV